MANIFTRAALGKIMADEALTPEQRTEQVFALYGRALDDGYISKGAAQQAQETALEKAKADWAKEQTVPDPKESDAYKQLAGEYDAYRAMQAARTSADYKDVKPKFFETVYGLVNRGDGADPVDKQLEAIRKDYEEYFNPAQPAGDPSNTTPPGKPAPTVVLPNGNPPAPGAAKLTLSEAMRRANAGEQIDVSQIGR